MELFLRKILLNILYLWDIVKGAPLLRVEVKVS